jgi:hypothetical protein
MRVRMAGAVAALVLLLAEPVFAGVYKCTAADGSIQYTDTPCGESATAIRKPAAPTSPATTQDQRMQKTRRLLDAMEAERNEEKRLAAEAKAEKEKRKRNCVVARDRYRRLTTANRLYDLDEQGNRVILNDAQRLQTEASAKAEIQRWCD